MLLPEGGVFYTALLYIGTSLVSYNASAWRGGFYTALFHLLQYYRVNFLSIRCFGLKEGFFFLQPYFISAHLWYHTMFLLEEGVFIQPYSISYSITLWLKEYEQPFYFILHIIDYFTLFLSLVHCCIGYLSVLAWQAAEAAAGSPAQASWTATRVLPKGLPC